jgi:hypothetical protein
VLSGDLWLGLLDELEDLGPTNRRHQHRTHDPTHTSRRMTRHNTFSFCFATGAGAPVV